MQSLMNPLLSYSINIQYCIVMQCIGAGVPEVDTILVFLNIGICGFSPYFTKMEKFISSYERKSGKEQVQINLNEEAALSPEDDKGNNQISACTDTI